MAIVKFIKEIRASGHSGAAQGLMITEKYEEALEKINKAISLDPNGKHDPLYLACKGEIYMRLVKFEKAIPILEQSLYIMDDILKNDNDGSSYKWIYDKYSQVVTNLEYCRNCAKDYPKINADKQ